MPAESQQSNKRGQLLVEAMIAISVMVIGLLGIFSLTSQSLGLYRVAYEQYVAVNLAAEGIEVVKNMIDTNVIAGSVQWNEGLAIDGDFGIQYDSRSLDATLQSKNLLYDASTSLYNYTSGTPTNFKRVIKIKNIDPPGLPNQIDEIQVNSVVTWKTRGGLDLSINLEDHFFNWR
ncbi:MAG: hypothetical protein AUJ39_00925 [Parcubacteria group bacterium CG1_02_42_13]|uniref:Type 4 fimbrial biogenesis protein PilX N-terminal domain-containing protein n=1 Tax=Candidatus Colwellbacteria bacterium CG23_combo_of_CG06-09_8_20_14_all_42_19 TaxID=1974541 RepID=A0A2H0AMN8_9BACT|nr:MAG: hypothetical protein AUJ39_00925 [Parcubacteria group bacterium CG1_02_42_13]PIP46682.1 MAG: hypothetical protein COX15_00055 [Candidatus Colwellbacteria bacterium CG23_combo_of_CG06-09_8_20_14_all_42_19]